MGLEIVYFLGAFLLLVGLIYGTLSWHDRNRAAARAADDITRRRYQQEDRLANAWPVELRTATRCAGRFRAGRLLSTVARACRHRA